MKYLIYIIVGILMIGVANATTFDLRNGVINHTIFLDQAEHEILISDSTKILVKTGTSFNQTIPELKSFVFPTEPSGIYQSQVIHSIVLQSFIIDMQYDSTSNYTLTTEITQLDTTNLLKESINWYAAESGNWNRKGVYSVNLRDVASTQFVLAGYAISNAVNESLCTASICQQYYTNDTYNNVLDECKDELDEYKDDLDNCQDDHNDMEEKYNSLKIEYDSMTAVECEVVTLGRCRSLFGDSCRQRSTLNECKGSYPSDCRGPHPPHVNYTLDQCRTLYDDACVLKKQCNNTVITEPDEEVEKIVETTIFGLSPGVFLVLLAILGYGVYKFYIKNKREEEEEDEKYPPPPNPDIFNLGGKENVQEKEER